jgi:Leucine-rich repeat (LRR) protein
MAVQKGPKLNLTKTSITSMDKLEADEFLQIEVLELYNNFISRTDLNSFTCLKNLRVLNLSANELDEIPNFAALVNCTELYLSHNKIQKVLLLNPHLTFHRFVILKPLND